MRRIRTSALTALIALAAGAALAPAASGQTAGPIHIDDGAPPTTADPYPAPITVSTPYPVVANVEVSLNGLVHDVAEDVDVLLAAPDGRAMVVMSDAGGDYSVDGNLNFRDGAYLQVPAPAVSGTYKPTDLVGGALGDVFPAPAPAGPYHNSFAAFRGGLASGEWRLFVVDDEADLAGVIDSWTITVSSRAGWDLYSEFDPPGSERTGTATFRISRRIRRVEAGVGPASLRYETVAPGRKLLSGTAAATPGRDYTPVSGTVSFAAGALEATVTVPILQDRAQEKREEFALRLFDPRGDVGFRPGRSELLLPRTITDDEPRLAKPALRARRVQRVLKQRGVVVRVRSNVDASLFATGRIGLPGGAARTIRLKRALAPAPAGMRFPMKLKLSRQGMRLVRRALAAGRRPVARVRVAALAESGAKTAASMRIRLKR
jgi:subtilisin-like proprotein convertase family protein